MKLGDFGVCIPRVKNWERSNTLTGSRVRDANAMAESQ
jgi:hypothetical protein